MTPKSDREKPAMAIDFRVRGITFTDEMREAVERIMAFAIDRYDTQIDKVSMCLVDLNGPKGGVDKLCQITARLIRGNPVLILEKGTEILSTVNRAARRLDHRIGRRVQRQNRPGLQRFRKSIRTA
jgi:putative sigma-54 modulation protein